MSMKWGAVLVGLLALAGCAEPPPDPAAQADASACTAQADAAYRAQDYDSLARTSQTGLYFANTPNHVFDAEQQGALHQRDSAITNCESNGDNDLRPASGAPLVTPHIVPGN